MKRPYRPQQPNLKSKEALFEDFVRVTDRVIGRIDTFFGVEAARETALDLEPGDTAPLEPDNSERTRRVKAHLRASYAWDCLSDLYDYAIDGIQSRAAEDIVLSGADVVHLLTSESSSLDESWADIIEMADSRFGLEEGAEVRLEILALLANVDVRTVRNAVSAGELITTKSDGTVRVDNASARAWLAGRRGFKPTRIVGAAPESLDELRTPADLARYLVAKRTALGIDLARQKIVVRHTAVDSHAIAAVERGAFPLPLDAVFPLADFYQVDRRELLAAIMRIHFSPQLEALADLLKKDGR